MDHLSDMLLHYNQTSDILYYEVLDIPLPELQGLKTLKVAFHHATKDEVVIYTIRLPKQSTVGDVINDLKGKVELSHPNVEFRLLEVFYHKIYEIPEEEKNLGPHDRLIHVYHFMKDTAQNQVQVQNFGEHFSLSSTRVRLWLKSKYAYRRNCRFLMRSFQRVVEHMQHILHSLDMPPPALSHMCLRKNQREGEVHRFFIPL
ncbi:ubiquitin carboxyl-terminal hydrolase 12-like isoform X4 [Camellia sinensis]|uniref:ubiquitin carboxyl-terminal hydrolase 12-like isoform X4 n=1 Tax=Camellia sinensis TaxID=4442 RepID=UPI0010356211|nr:ubiquitin carboxyl-terminal hydrolase 12-like isoform X4 [Camellia sinensis]